jgi:DNA-binding response OmpR family regulator
MSIAQEKPDHAALTGTLLIVDDSTDDLSLLVDYFRDTGMRIAVALDGREGYQKAMVIRPDLILMDLRMPGADGHAACRLLKADARTRDIPVIFVSGSNEPEERVASLRMGAVDYISKPFTPAEVVERVRIHLDLSRRAKSSLTMPGTQPALQLAEGDVAPALNTLVVAAMTLLRNELARPPALPELARQVGTNERKLTELFRQATGMPVFTWLREERFQVASRMLVETDLDIQQIAVHVGYGSAGNFTTMFRERLGVTPRDFRQARREAGS